jgi:hypothetical protein
MSDKRTNCCSAKFLEESDLCSSCKEHASPLFKPDWKEVSGILGPVANATHLGDGAYLAIAQYGYVLFAYDGIFATNVVYLEPEVVDSLLKTIAHFDELLGRD